MRRPSATAGEDAARRSIAPSISTCSAPCASIASLTARTSAAALGPATSIAPGSCRRATAPGRAACASPSPRAARVGWPLARSRPSVVATRLPAARSTRGFSMREVDHVALLAVAPDRGDADAPSLRLELAQQCRERLRLAGVLGEADEREAPGLRRELAEGLRHAGVDWGDAASAWPSELASEPPPAARAASSRTMNVARWCGSVPLEKPAS